MCVGLVGGISGMALVGWHWYAAWVCVTLVCVSVVGWH